MSEPMEQKARFGSAFMRREFGRSVVTMRLDMWIRCSDESNMISKLMPKNGLEGKVMNLETLSNYENKGKPEVSARVGI